MTEAAIHSTYYEIQPDDPWWPSAPYGMPVANIQCRVVDKQGRDCPDWVKGELWVSGVGVATGYHGDEERTAEKFVVWQQRRWYRTGDVASYRPDGILDFFGRADNQVKIRGHRVELGEVEGALSRLQQVENAVAVVLSGATRNTRKLAAALLAHQPLDLAAIKQLLQRSPQRIAEDAFDHLAEHADVAAALTRWMQQPEEKRLQALQAASMAQGVYHQQDETHPLFASRYALFGHSLASVGQYHPNPWLGKTIVLRNSESDPLLPGTPGDVHECWNALCLGELIVEDTPGDHFSCLSRHHAPVLAELIARHTVQAVVS